MALTTLTATGRDSNGAYIVLDGNRKFYYYDAEKTSAKSDDNLCWAGAASNLLAAGGWNAVKGIKSSKQQEDDVLDYFRSNFKLSDKYGALTASGLKWFLTGTWDLAAKSLVDQPKSGKSGGFYKGIDFDRYAGTISAAPSNMASVYMLSKNPDTGLAVGVGFYTNTFLFSERVGGHGLTCWAISVNSAHSPDNPAYYTGLWISDPDDSRNVGKGGRNAPDNLTYLPMVWDAQKRSYWITPEYLNSGDVKVYLENFTYLYSRPASYTQSGTVSFATPSNGNITGGAAATSQPYSIPQYTGKETVKLSITVENDDWLDAAGGVLEVYVDGEFYTRFDIGALAPGKQKKFRNLTVGQLDAGEHLVQFFLDNGHDAGAFDGYEELSLRITPEKEADLRFASDGEEGILFSDDGEEWTALFSLANYGRARSSGNETVTLRVDGNELAASATKRLQAGREEDFALLCDYDLASGNHYFELILSGNAGSVLDVREFFVSVSPEDAPQGTPQFIKDEEGVDDSEQAHIELVEGFGVEISGAFDTAGDQDIYSFLNSQTGPRTLNFAFYGAAGELALTRDGITLSFGRGIHSVTVDGDFSLTVTGTGDATGIYNLSVAPPGQSLTVNAPELILSRDTVRLAPGNSVEIELYLAWDPGREVRVSLTDLFGGNPFLTVNAEEFRFDSSNWFAAQKLVFTLDAAGNAIDDLYYRLSAAGLEDAWLQLSLRNTGLLIAPTLLAVAATGNGCVKLTWAANADDYDYITVRSRNGESGEWEDCGRFDLLAGGATLAGNENTQYSIAGIAMDGSVSEWSDVMIPGDSQSRPAVAPVLNGVPGVETNLRRAQISYQRASDDDGVQYYELRYGVDADLSAARVIRVAGLSVTLNNLSNGEYFYSLRAVDRDGLSSDWSDTRSFTIDYQAPEDADDYRLTKATALILNEFHTETIGGGDNADYFTVNLESGRYQLSGDFGTGQVRVSLYDSFGRKVRSTVSGKDGVLSGKATLLAAGTYFVRIENRNFSAGESAYRFAVTGEEFPTGNPGNNLPGVATRLGATVEDGTLSVRADGYVGYGDAVDFYRFETGRGGLFSLRLDTESAKAKITVGTLTAKGTFQALKTVSSGKELANLMLEAGEYYIRVQAVSASNGKGNTGYEFTISADLFAGVADNSDDTLKTARKIETGTVYEDWVGFGDRKDCFEFELAADGRVSLELSGLTDGETVPGLRLALYDAANRQLRLDGDWNSRDPLAAGNYKVMVEMTGDRKREAAYQLQIIA